MIQHIELAKERLFAPDALACGNVKLFPGSSRDASPGQLAEQINRSLSQIEAGDFDLVAD